MWICRMIGCRPPAEPRSCNCNRGRKMTCLGWTPTLHRYTHTSECPVMSDTSKSSLCLFDDEDEPQPLVLNLACLETAVQKLYVSVKGGDCDVTVRFQKLTVGRYHEIFVAQYFRNVTTEVSSELIPSLNHPAKSRYLKSRYVNSTDSDPCWECIVSFSRVPKSVAKLHSEVATMNLLSCGQHTLPVPPIYAYDFTSENDVGAQYMIMQNLPGRHLYKIWDRLDMDDKRNTVEQIASILAVLSEISCDLIGSLSHDPGTDSPSSKAIGPLLFLDAMDRSDGTHYVTSSAGPFATTQDYLEYFLAKRCGNEVDFEDALDIIEDFFKAKGSRSCLLPPFRLIHGDFDAQNLLFLGGRIRRPSTHRRHRLGIVSYRTSLLSLQLSCLPARYR